MQDRQRTFILTAAILTAVAVILFIAGPVTPKKAATPEPGDERTLTVYGEGEIVAKPDVATVVFEVVGTGATAQAAQAETNSVVVAVTQALRQTGVPPKQVNVTGLHVGVSDDEFRGVQVLEVDVTDLARLSESIDAALTDGATAVRSVTYGFRRETDLRQQAVDRAIRDARARAQAAADGSGVTLHSLRNLQVMDARSGNPDSLAVGSAGTEQTLWRATVLATFDIR